MVPIPESEQKELVDDLAGLVQRHGAKRFLEAALVEPTAEYFGEPWDGSDDALLDLADDVFGYAGVDALNLTVAPARLPPRQTNRTYGKWLDPGRANRVSVLAWGPVEVQYLDSHECVLTASDDLSDIPGVVASLCRAAALAFEATTVDSPYRSSVWTLPEADDRRRLVDVTTIYLGLGILTTNDAYRLLLVGERTTAKHVHRRAGFLDEQSMAFLLALQARARGGGRKERNHVAGLLEPNQAGYFRDSFDAIDDATCARLSGA